jgi:hypothetical protein
MGLVGGDEKERGEKSRIDVKGREDRDKVR